MRVFERVLGKNIGKEMAFYGNMRKLWADHIIWMRMVLLSTAAGLPDTAAAVDRLMQNQLDLGNVFKPFYGDAAGDKLTSLLREHASLAYELIKAAKAGDRPKIEATSRAWYANADDLAVLLSVANPTNWPAPQMKAHMKEHLDLTLAEVNARLAGNWIEDISDFDKVRLQILQLADLLSDGILAQFPNRFR